MAFVTGFTQKLEHFPSETNLENPADSMQICNHKIGNIDRIGGAYCSQIVWVSSHKPTDTIIINRHHATI